MNYFKTVSLVLAAIILQACSDENSSEIVQKTEAQKIEEIRPQYGSWEDLCKVRPECDDYPIGYETLITENIPYYIPLDTNKRNIFSGNRRPNRDFAQFSNDFKSIKRIVNISHKKRRNISFNIQTGRFPSYYLPFLAEYYGFPYDPKEKTNIYSGLTGAYWAVDDKPPLLFSRYLHQDIIREIENYKVGSKHDYDDNFWFVSHGRSLKTGNFLRNPNQFVFISKKKILFDHRLLLICRIKLCKTIIGVLQSDVDKYGTPKIGYSLRHFVLPKSTEKTLTCINHHPETCVPVKGLLYTLPNYLDIIKQIIKNISTKPDDIEGYGE